MRFDVNKEYLIKGVYYYTKFQNATRLTEGNYL